MSQPHTWRKSSYSVTAPNCVEIAPVAPAVLVRDSKNPDQGHIGFSPAQLGALVDACTEGQLDHLDH